MHRRRIVSIIAAVVVLIAGVLVVLTRDGGPKDRADYCTPPKLLDRVARIGEDPTKVTAAFTHLVPAEWALGVAEVPDGRVLIASKDGTVSQAPASGGMPSVVLDLSGEVATNTEQGLLGVAVPPAGGAVYLDATLKDGTARILEYQLTPEGIDVASRRDVLVLDDPHPSHNGGKMAFDSTGMLMIGIGDGGNGDRTGAAQDLSSPFGKLLRIDPRPVNGRPYGIPRDNPFVGRSGGDGAVWAYGFRNPWGWTIDPATDDLWVGDVGQLCFEEISVAAEGGKGQNFGWPHVEGAHEFLGPVLGLDGEPVDLPVAKVGALPPDRVPPVLEYPHGAEACSVLGGVVYRGKALPELEGVYLWADLCERAIHTLRRAGDHWVSGRLRGVIPKGIVSFAQAADGEVYLLSLDDGLYRLAAPSVG